MGAVIGYVFAFLESGKTQHILVYLKKRMFAARQSSLVFTRLDDRDRHIEKLGEQGQILGFPISLVGADGVSVGVFAQLLASHDMTDQPSFVAIHLYWTLYLGVLAFWSQDTSPNQEDTLVLLDQSMRLFTASLAANQSKAEV